MTGPTSSKRKRILLWGAFGALLVLSAIAVGFARLHYSLAPTFISKSSFEFGAKLSDPGRLAAYRAIRSQLFQVSAVFTLIGVLWAVFTGLVIWRVGRPKSA